MKFAVRLPEEWQDDAMSIGVGPDGWVFINSIVLLKEVL